MVRFQLSAQLLQVISLTATRIGNDWIFVAQRTDEFSQVLGNGLVMTVVQKLPSRCHHVFAVTRVMASLVLGTQQIDVALLGNVETVSIITAQRIAKLPQC